MLMLKLSNVVYLPIDNEEKVSGRIMAGDLAQSEFTGHFSGVSTDSEPGNGKCNL